MCNRYVTRLTMLVGSTTVGSLAEDFGKLRSMARKKTSINHRDEPALPFDVTQEIDPALADELRRTSEPTLTQADFDDVTIVLPEKPKPLP